MHLNFNSVRKSAVLIFLFLLSFFQLIAQPPCNGNFNSGVEDGACGGFPNHDTPLCNLNFFSNPPENALDLPIITIRVNVHLIASEYGGFTPNHSNSLLNGNEVADGVIREMNNVMSDLDNYNLYDENGQAERSFTGDGRIRFEIFSDPSINPNDIHDGVFYHPAPPSGTNVGQYVGAIALQAEYPNVINLVFYDTEPFGQNVPSTCGQGGAGCQGVFLAGARIFNMYVTHYNLVHDPDCTEEQNGTFEFGRSTLHEIGHSAGLCHSYSNDNECIGIGAPNEDGVIPEWECKGPFTSIGSINNILCGDGHGGHCLNGATNNIMSSGSGRGALTRCQWKVFYRNCVEGSFGFSDLCETEPPLIITNPNEMWEHLRLIKNQTVVIEPGAKLQINNCQVRMAAGANFHVKRGGRLEIVNSTITNLCNGERWGSIYVEGSESGGQPPLFGSSGANQAGVLNINGSLLTHGGSVIKNYRLGESWNRAYTGGLIHCNDVSFIDNSRAAEFLKHNIMDNSFFNNCRIDASSDPVFSGTKGISVWSCTGIRFQNNDFSNLSYGLIAYNSRIVVETGNSFTNLDTGIEIYSTHPGSSQDEIGILDVGQNEFDSNITHIQIFKAQSGGETDIVYNNFRNASNAAIYAGGRHVTSVYDNFFENNPSAMVVFNTGNGISNFECNNLVSGEIGFVSELKNSSFIFNANDFNTTLADGVLGNSASIAPEQGGYGNGGDDENWSPSNSFSSVNVEDILTSTSSEVFTYVVPSLASNNFEPDGNGNYTKTYINKDEEGCSIAYGPPLIIHGPPFTAPELEDIRNIKNTRKEEYEANPSDEVLKRRYEQAIRAKDRVLSWLTSDAIKSQAYDLAESYLTDQTDKEEMKAVYGIKVIREDYAGATMKLNNLPEDEASDTEFKQLQEINLAWLQSGTPPAGTSFEFFQSSETESRDESGGFRLSIEQEELIRRVAFDDESPNKGIALGLLGLLKDERYIAYVDMDKYREMGRKLIEEYPHRTNIRVFPNPTTNEVIIDNLSEFLSELQVEVLDVSGKKVYSAINTVSNGKVTFNIGDKSEGVYFLLLRKADNIIHRQKIVVLK